jgi:tetratricopeptide (TPR) repeat protein
MPDPTPPSSPRSGNWIVIVLILLGLAAAGTAYVYWTNFVTVGPKGPPVGGDFDPDLANKELAQLDDDLAEAKRIRRFNSILDKARAFVARYPKYPPAYTLLAKVYIELYEWPKAYAELEKSLALASNQPMVHQLAGTMQYEMRDYEKAEDHYRTAHVLNPNDPLHLVYIAQVFIRTNRLEEASVRLLEAIALNSKSHEAYATMSDLFMKRNEPSQALQQIDKALEFAAANERGVVVPYVLKRAAVQRRAGDPQGAMQTLDEMLHDSEMMEPYVAKDVAETFGMLNQPDKAAEFYERATAANPTEWLLLAGAVDWALKANNLPMAKRSLRSLEKLDPHLPALRDLRNRVAAADKAAGG